MTSSLGHPTLEETIKNVYLTRIENYIILSSMVLYLYYYVTTLDNEISLMWNARFGVGKLLFYSLRYFTLLYVTFVNIVAEFYSTNISAEVSIPFKMVNYTSYTSGFVIILLADFTLQLKLYALYQKSKKVLTFLIIIFISMVIYYTTFAAIMVKNRAIILDTNSEGDIPTHSIISPPYYTKILVPKSITEGIMLVLALRVGIKNMRQNRGIEISNSLFNLLHILIMFVYTAILVSNWPRVF
ncbi:hypothetical protein PNOK_0827500 [Pyrrhoderma noxium]|uniref:DUF6533 domain-containing protein n=1 Tax=Pyrrhoderma noxium TaxID=2282107 RepID=A0A286UAS6_9AGAM|nr:hypothetical protein PNOK_0827500 [Pyrrhoderma noxium]